MNINDNKKNFNNLNNWLNKYFSLLVIIILILFILAAYFIILAPRFKDIKQNLDTNIKNEEVLYSVSQKKLYTLEDIVKVYKNIKPGDLQKFNTVLPSSYVPERLYGELEEIVSNGGWLVNSIKFDNLKGTKNNIRNREKAASTILTKLKSYPGLSEYQITMKVSSIDYGGLKNLLYSLEDNLRLIDVTNLTFSPGEKTAVITLRTYYYNNH